MLRINSAIKRCSRLISMSCLLSIFAMPVANALTLPVRDDTFSNPVRPTLSFGASKILLVGNGTPQGIETYVRFDLSALPKDAAINLAVLRIWVDNVQNEGNLTVHSVLGDWRENELTAAARPQTGALSSQVAVNDAAKKKYVMVDVTDIVKNWQSGQPNHGIALKTDSQKLFRLTLNSKENDLTSHAMEIEVAFEGISGPKGDKGKTGPAGPRGIRGIPGQIGPRGETGDDGDVGLSEFQRVNRTEFIGSAFENGKLVAALCPPGKVAVGGACDVADKNTQMIAYKFINNRTGYSCAFSTSGINVAVAAIVTCATVGSPEPPIDCTDIPIFLPCTTANRLN